MQQRQPYSSDGVSCMILDCIAYLNQSRMLRVSGGKAKKTGKLSSMFVLRCESVVHNPSVAAISAELERVWISDLCFDGESHRTNYKDADVCFDFITWWDQPDSSYVTGTFVIAVPSST